MKKTRSYIFLPVFLILFLFIFSTFPFLCRGALFKRDLKEEKIKKKNKKLNEDSVYKEYIDFFEEIFEEMDKNYYQKVSRDKFNRFVKKFREQIYNQLKGTGKSIDYIRWRSASMLVHSLKAPEDIFSEFYPPQPADDYEQTALGKKQDVGLEGETTEEGYEIALVEPRSDAFIEGLNIGDVILSINGQSIVGMDRAGVEAMLEPVMGSEITVEYRDAKDGIVREKKILSDEYFKQTVFMIPLPVPGIFGLEVQRFNRKTATDFFRYLTLFRQKSPILGLILDFRGNPGGPPLAAQEISSFFLTPGDDFAYFQKKGYPKAQLKVPRIPEVYRYKGPIVILIDEGSGSAAELFSGVMQKKGRAILMGTHSAGQVMLKSMFKFDDNSMLLLITSRGYFPDGKPFSFGGLIPNREVDEGERDIIDYALTYLVYVLKQEGKLN